MNPSRRRFSQLVLGVIAASALPPALADLEEGQDWRAINPPQPGDVPGKIEVLEFFSYGCPHCSAFNPSVKSWAKTLDGDIVFRRIPVTFGRQAWANLARLYYVLESSGDLEQLDQDVFYALHEEGVKLYTEAAMVEWLDSKGVDTKSFSDVFNSFDIQAKIGRSDSLIKQYQIDAVPTLTVAGRYAVLGRRVKAPEELLTIAAGLIDKARKDGTPA